MENFTWADLAKAISEMPKEQQEKEVFVSIEDESRYRKIDSIQTVDKDVFVNIYDNDDIGTMQDLKDAHGEDFILKSYRLLTPSGFKFLWDGF